jgi:hypothetical protein
VEDKEKISREFMQTNADRKKAASQLICVIRVYLRLNISALEFGSYESVTC